MAKQWLIAFALVVLGLAAAGTYTYLSRGGEDVAGQARPPSIVNATAPVLEVVRDTLSAVGNLRSREAVELTTEVSGRVVELNIAPGARVAQGQLLVRLDDRQASADLQVAEAQLADARRQFERARSLRANNSISQSQVDELRTALDVARAQLTSARTRLDNHRIEAPFAGVVGLSEISIGAYLAAGSAITTLDATNPMELNFAIPERFLGQIRQGQPVQGMSPAFPSQSFDGRLVELGSRINELSRTLPVRALVDNAEGRLRPNQFMSVTLVLGERDALVIPEQAVLIRGADTYVFVADDGKARRVAVTLGSRSPGRVEVVTGLTVDDQVIVTGQDRLSSGDRIDVVEDDSAIPDNRFAVTRES
ncbi:MULTISPECIES: efflux RND transporter periplasmic adaptor subunit [Marinobacter]|uniref:Efflux transporter periplasmic adaptor subunit n=1 Tax=Marinobacter profundi TaxID=2666256 RepID=A0A2G1UL80_9GAMM|nr:MULTISPECIES: efflux RND transporter periplasmic adaptor subunit [Marinobacter]MBD3658598.1 efflux RND transporter periplasmic adaptor subunit [Marinobacter sp.]PHQ15179.1 efflux transporter periplasmic adaptor subunit [Marinobacter profundi]